MMASKLTDHEWLIKELIKRAAAELRSTVSDEQINDLAVMAALTFMFTWPLLALFAAHPTAKTKDRKRFTLRKLLVVIAVVCSLLGYFAYTFRK